MITISQSDPALTESPAGLPATRVLGVPVTLQSMECAVRTILGWAARAAANFVCVRDVHGVMRAQDDPMLLELHSKAGMVTADGMPLVWLSRLRGHQVERVCGADLVTAVVEAGLECGLRHYFYGGKPGVAEQFAEALAARHPGLLVAGTGTPPFRQLTLEEDREETGRIISANPQVVWVGLSTPKQEYWMRDHVSTIPGAILIGVGAAFDFHAGLVKRAPRWMQRCGLEWFHRLVSEPRRLWRRYLILAPKFLYRVITTEFVAQRAV